MSLYINTGKHLSGTSGKPWHIVTETETGENGGALTFKTVCGKRLTSTKCYRTDEPKRALPLCKRCAKPK